MGEMGAAGSVPVFEREGVTLYHGDCREILPMLPADAAIITDPPYGMGWDIPGIDVERSRPL